MSKINKIIWFPVLLFAVTIVAVMKRDAYADVAYHPKLINIGYCQVGGYYEFDYMLYEIGSAMLETGDIESEKLSGMSLGDSADKVWDALSSSKSDYYRFKKEAFYDFSDPQLASLDDKELTQKIAELISEHEIDLMITMGTSAGLVVKDACEVPYMNFLASDPVSSKIVENEDFSGDDRAWAHVNTGVEEKAFAVMGDIFNPQKIGIVYNDEDPEAYIYSGAKNLDIYAGENGKEVIKAYVSDPVDDTEASYKKYYKELYDAHKKMAESGIDVYILTSTYLEAGDFVKSLTPLMEKGIAVFSINSTEDVRFGALAAVEMYDYKNIGRFSVENMKKYRDGTSLAELPQKYVTSPFLVLNADSLKKTGVKLPIEAVISASKIYAKYEE